MNHVILNGRLTREPELIHRSERAICKMRIAVNNGEYPTTYVDVVSFDRQAYACAEYLSKGRKVGVTGKLVYHEWRDEEDKRHERYSVIGRVEFLDPPPSRRPDPVAVEPQSPTPEPELEEEPEPEELQLALAA